MRKIKVTMQEVVTYRFDIEVEDDFEATDETVAEEAEEAFVNSDPLPPTVSVDERDLVRWEEVKP